MSSNSRIERRRQIQACAVAAPPLKWHDPSLLQIGECRTEYVTWHRALTRLAHDLAGKLKQFQPIAPGAAAMPCITGDAPVSRVVARRDLGGIYAGLPLTPRRSSGGKPIESPIEAETRASHALAPRTKRRKPLLA
jgi:hypothetical protein